MCSPVAVGVMAGVGAISSVGSYLSTSSALRQQGQAAMQSAALQSSMFQSQAQMSMMQSGMLSAQAGLFNKSASMFTQQAGMFLDQSNWSVRMGKILSAQEYARARQTESDAERASMVAAEQRRLKTGAAMAGFAANGVSVDASTSVQLWEQDEMADLAFEMGTIKEKRDNEVWGYVWQGDTKKMQGLFDAQSYAIQSQGALINAGTESMKAQQAKGEAGLAVMQAGIFGLQSQNALLAGQAAQAQANAGRQNALWGMVGSIAGLGTSAFGMMAGGFGQPRGGGTPLMSGAGGDRTYGNLLY